MADLSLEGLIRPYKSEFYLLSKCVDVVCIIGSLALLCWLYDKSWQVQVLPAITATVLFQIFAEFGRLYRSNRSEFLGRELLQIYGIWIAVMFMLLLLAYGFKMSSQYSRLAIGSWFVIAPLSLCLWRVGLRITLRFFRQRGYNSRVIAIAGASASGVEVAKIIQQSGWMGLRIFGFFDDRKPSHDRTTWTGSVEGDFDELVRLAHNKSIDVIYIALPFKSAERIQMLIDKLADTTASVYIVPEAFWINMLRGRWVNLGSLPVVSVYETPFYGINGWLKRLEDVLLASVIILLIIGPAILIAIGVKLSSRGPILYKQKRYGLDGQEIEVWKFRTLRVCEEDGKIQQVTKNDNRVTWFGALLRSTSLDELPQFFNVLQGSMSIVGPRPHAVVHNEYFRPLVKEYMVRHKVKPGITGWAQVNGWRGETETIDKMEQRVKHDLWYIHNWSLWLDLKIILLTLYKGFINKNAF